MRFERPVSTCGSRIRIRRYRKRVEVKENKSRRGEEEQVRKIRRDAEK